MTLASAEKQGNILVALEHMNLELRSGGSGANTMAGIANLGGTSFYTGKVARDTNGEFYRQDMVKGGIHFDINPAERSDGPTGTCVVLTTPDAERTMYTHLGVSVTLQPEDIVEEKIKDSKFIYLEGYLWDAEGPRAAVKHAANLAKKHGVKTSFTMSDGFLVERYKEDFRSFLKESVDLVFCNADEARQFLGLDSLTDCAKILGEMCELVFVTHGKDGALAVEKGNITEVPGFKVDAIDTNGAGDAFAAGALVGLSRNASMEKSARLGNFLASKVVQIHGPRLEKKFETEANGILT